MSIKRANRLHKGGTARNMDRVQPSTRQVPSHQLEHRLAATAAHAALAELLVLPAADLELRIEHELATNPALVSAVPPACGRCGAALDGLHQAYGCGRPATAVGGLPADLAATEPAESLLLAGVPTVDRWIAVTILADLDERGLLGRNPAAAAEWLGVPEQRVHRVLAALRAVSRPDLAAADLGDALHLQIGALDLPAAQLELLRALVDGHLADVGADRVERIATALGLDLTAARDGVALLRRVLRPPAGVERDEAVGPPVVPDIVVRWSAAGTPEVLVPEHGPRLRIDAGYARLAGQPPTGLDPAQLARLRAQVGDAREFLARLARRSGALRQIAATAIGQQQAYLRHGALAHQPMTRTGVARLAGVHPSTVSRAASGKRVLLPDGRLVGFATFFGTATSVRERVAELIAAESQPLSDGQLAAALRGYGHRIARRTVAKYRAQLAIPAADHR